MNISERAAMAAALREAVRLRRTGRTMVSLVTDIGAARGRTIQRQESDRKTDAARRQLVGARLQLADAQRCRACASALQVSLYRFATDALMQACCEAEAAHAR